MSRSLAPNYRERVESTNCTRNRDTARVVANRPVLKPSPPPSSRSKRSLSPARANPRQALVSDRLPNKRRAVVSIAAAAATQSYAGVVAGVTKMPTTASTRLPLPSTHLDPVISLRALHIRQTEPLTDLMDVEPKQPTTLPPQPFAGPDVVAHVHVESSPPQPVAGPDVAHAHAKPLPPQPVAGPEVATHVDVELATQLPRKISSSPITLRLLLDGLPVVAVLADNSDVTIIKHSIAAQLNQRDWSTPAVIRSPTGGRLPARGPVSIVLATSQSEAQLNIYAANIQADCILGCDALAALDIEVSSENVSCRTNSVNKLGVVLGPHHVHLLQRISLPPRAESITIGRVAGLPTEEPGTAYLVEPGTLTLPAGVQVARSLTHIKDGQVAVRLINGSDRAVKLESGRLVAHLDVALEIAHTKMPILRVQSLGLGGTPPTLPIALDTLVSDAAKDPLFTNETAIQLKSLLSNHLSLFARDDGDLGRTDLTVHDIHTELGAAPIRQPPRRPPVALQEENRKILADMLEKGVIEESHSAWASPVVLVKKKDGTLRFCVDYRRLNDITVKDSFPLPRIDATLDSLGGAEWFTTLDLLSGYWQVALSRDAQAKSAFCTPYGLFQWTRMPFGLCNSPATFERLLETVLCGLRWESCLVYLDDIIIFGKTKEQLLQRMDEVFTRLTAAGLKIKPANCRLFRREISYLGHTISPEGVRVDPAQFAALQDWPIPRTIRDVRSFVTYAAYYRRYVTDFAVIAAPLRAISQEKRATFRWTELEHGAFSELKRHLLNAPSLTFPVDCQPVILDTDASDLGMGAVLSQIIDGEERMIACASQVFNEQQRHYCTTRRELLALVTFLQQFRAYTYNRTVIVRTDHSSLRWLRNFKTPDGLLARWLEILGEYTIEIRHRAGIHHGNADGLSRQTCDQCFGHPGSLLDQDELARADGIIGTVRMAVRIEPEFSSEQLRMAQLQDEDIAWIVLAKDRDERPDPIEGRTRSHRARAYLASWPTLLLIKGVLYRTLLPGIEPWNTQQQFIVPHALKRHFFEQAHAGQFSAHFGDARTYATLREVCYWQGMSADVRVWCATCITCSLARPPPTRPRAEMQPMTTGMPLDRIAIDVLCGFPATARGNTLILVCCDYFTKWAEAWPMVDQKADVCMKHLLEGFCLRYGIPEQLHADQGTNFESYLVHEVSKALKMEKTRTTAFHPRSDGMCERLNRTILLLLKKAVKDHPEDWDLRLPYLMHAYRASRHASTGMTPNFLMFGREVRTPVSLLVPAPLATPSPNPWAAEMVERFHAAYALTRQRLRAAARTQKSYYDRRVQRQPYWIGRQVKLYAPQLKRGQKKKLTCAWSLGWVVEGLPTATNVIIRKGRTQRRVHFDRIEPLDSTEKPPPVPPVVDATLASPLAAEPNAHETTVVLPTPVPAVSPSPPTDRVAEQTDTDRGLRASARAARLNSSPLLSLTPPAGSGSITPIPVADIPLPVGPAPRDSHPGLCWSPVTRPTFTQRPARDRRLPRRLRDQAELPHM